MMNYVAVVILPTGMLSFPFTHSELDVGLPCDVIDSWLVSLEIKAQKTMDSRGASDIIPEGTKIRIQKNVGKGDTELGELIHTFTWRQEIT